jgi:hypothetical protein
MENALTKEEQEELIALKKQLTTMYPLFIMIKWKDLLNFLLKLFRVKEKKEYLLNQQISK